jgi:hypothetical protein
MIADTTKNHHPQATQQDDKLAGITNAQCTITQLLANLSFPCSTQGSFSTISTRCGEPERRPISRALQHSLGISLASARWLLQHQGACALGLAHTGQ